MPSKRTKVYPGPFFGGGAPGEEKSDEAAGPERDGSRLSSSVGSKGSLSSELSSSASPVDEAGKLLDFAVSMVNATTVAVAPPRATPGEVGGDTEDLSRQGEEAGAEEETETEEKRGEAGGDVSEPSSEEDDAGKLFDYAVSMAAATTTAVAPPRPERAQGTGEGEQDSPRGKQGPQGGKNQAEDGREEDEEKGDDNEEEEDSQPKEEKYGDSAGRLFDYAVSMVAASTPAVSPPRPEGDTGGEEEAVAGQEGAGGEQEDAERESGAKGVGDEELQQEDDDEPLGWLFDYAVSQAGLPTTEAGGRGGVDDDFALP